MRLGSLASPWAFFVCVALGGSAIAACGSKSAPLSGDDMGDDAGGESGSGSGSGAGSGSGSPTGSGSQAGSGSGSVSGSSDAASGSPVDASADGPTMTACGSDTCNLSVNTCCLTQDISGNPSGMCVPHGQGCPTFYAAFNCGGAVDCPAGQVCCGEANQNAGSAQTVCTASCPTMSASSKQGQAQVCRGSSECQNHMDCLPQQCLGTANLNLCGLTSQAPFDCVAK